jgi:hypothetical protein
MLYGRSDFMAIKQDLKGQKFGRLTALYTVPNNNYRTRWHCICDCGNTKDVLQQHLVNGHVRSCGCLHVERNREKLARLNASMNRESHSETKTRLYHIWISIKSRCFDEHSTSFPNYGGRGITVCQEWASSYLSFKEWAVVNGYNDKLSIDRINVDGNYCPDNCRWATGSVQQFNKRKPRRNTSGYVGISWNKKEKVWVAYITKDYIMHHLGSFHSLDEAIAARKAAEYQYFG